MDRTLRIAPVLLLIVAATGCKPPKPDTRDQLHALESSLPGAFLSDSEETWRVLQAAVPEATSCAREGEVLESFLELAPFVGNAEFGEFFSDVVEQTIVADPDCFLRTWARMGEWNQEWVATVVAYPAYRPYDEIRLSLQHAEQQDLATDLLGRAAEFQRKQREWPSTRPPSD